MNLEMGGMYRLFPFIVSKTLHKYDSNQICEFKNKEKQVKTSYSNEKIKNIIKLKTLSAFSV